MLRKVGASQPRNPSHWLWRKPHLPSYSKNVEELAIVPQPFCLSKSSTRLALFAQGFQSHALVIPDLPIHRIQTEIFIAIIDSLLVGRYCFVVLADLIERIALSDPGLDLRVVVGCCFDGLVIGFEGFIVPSQIPEGIAFSSPSFEDFPASQFYGFVKRFQRLVILSLLGQDTAFAKPVVRAAALNNIAYLPATGEVIGGRSCYDKEECQRGCQSNGANMPRCSHRGALFDFMSIP